MKVYRWHGKPCILITKAPYLRGVKRNALIEVEGTRIVVPARALRRGIMAMCEKCWRDAYHRALAGTSKAQAEHYHDLLKERENNPCSEAEQEGEMPKEE